MFQAQLTCSNPYQVNHELLRIWPCPNLCHICHQNFCISCACNMTNLLNKCMIKSTMLLSVLTLTNTFSEGKFFCQAKLHLNSYNLFASLILLSLCYYQEIKLNGNFKQFFVNIFVISNYLPACLNGLQFRLFVYYLLQLLIFQISARSHNIIFPLQKIWLNF